MASQKTMGDGSFGQLGIPPHAAPRCYSRRATPQAVSRPPLDMESNAILLALCVAVSVAGFLVVAYSGWSF